MQNLSDGLQSERTVRDFLRKAIVYAKCDSLLLICLGFPSFASVVDLVTSRHPRASQIRQGSLQIIYSTHFSTQQSASLAFFIFRRYNSLKYKGNGIERNTPSLDFTEVNEIISRGGRNSGKEYEMNENPGLLPHSICYIARVQNRERGQTCE